MTVKNGILLALFALSVPLALAYVSREGKRDRELSSLRRQLEEVARNMREKPDIAPPVAAAIVAGPPAPRRSDSPGRAHDATAHTAEQSPAPTQTVADQATNLEAAFATENPDRAWAGSAEWQLRERLERIAGSTVEYLSCRSTLCRSRVSMPAQGADMSRWIGASAVWPEGPTFVSKSGGADDTHVVFDVYYGRPGTELPVD